jgi:GTP-binding protein
MVVHGTMKIISADLHDQAFTPDQIPALDRPQVAVFGRSNVGKSSLLAAMMRRRKLVKVSSTPGKTRGIFFYIVNSCHYLVDLPGYGFSKAPRALAGKWHTLVQAYLDSRPGPSLALHLIDIRHPPTKDDLDVRQILAERKIPVIVVATKADKLSKSRRINSLAVISRSMGVPARCVIPVSVKDSSIPVDSVWEAILPLLERSS